MLRAKLSLLPGGTVTGTGEDARVEVLEAFGCFDGTTTLAIFTSMRHEPMASAVYLQKIGTMEEHVNRRDNGASDRSALPMKE